VQVIDYAGNITGTIVSIQNIDKSAVIGDITYDTTGFINGNVTATITFNKS
jgi:hypothetical protein